MNGTSKAALVSPVQKYLETLHERHRDVTSGKPADYIPELAKVDPNLFGIVIVTVNGQVYEVGDTRHEFTIQSISKPFSYAAALEDSGTDLVLKKVGVEPSGEAFNAISLNPDSGRPANPMINAGAIATVGLVEGDTVRRKMYRIIDSYSRYAGRRLEVDHSVYSSENETGHRNRAISHLLRNFGILEGDPEVALDAYFRQCSIRVNCRDLAVMAATLAAGGINPITNDRALMSECVPRVLGVMGTCGMYDFAGQWLYEVGLPAKSGVGGGIVAVLPGQLGIGVFSPPLDVLGNSVRGIKVCQDLSRDMGLHMFRVGRATPSVIRQSYDAAVVPSRRQRDRSEQETLRERARQVRIFELQGELVFGSCEVVVHDILEELSSAQSAVVDLGRVLSVDSPSCRLLAGLAESLRDAGKELFFTRARKHPLLTKILRRELGLERAGEIMAYDTLDLAIEAAEANLLNDLPTETDGEKTVFDLLTGVAADDLEAIRTKFQKATYAAGELLIRTGEPGDDIIFIAKGEVSILVPGGAGQPERLATYTAGMACGEMAALDRSPRSADVRADTPVICYRLPVTDLELLAWDHPTIKTQFMENVTLRYIQNLRRANREVRCFT